MREERGEWTVWPQPFGPRDGAGLVLLCVCAYAGNYFALSLFAGVDLLFGGVAVMYAALRRSLAETLLVAVVGSLHTLLLWGHPFGLLLFVIEAAFVHFARHRFRVEIIACDALFWLLAGGPLVALLYRDGLGMDPLAVGLIALKQPINGLAYTAAASLIHHALLLRAAPRGVPLASRTRLADLLAPVMLAFMLVPTLALLWLHTDASYRERLARVSDALADRATYLVSRASVDLSAPETANQAREALSALGFRDLSVAVREGDGDVLGEAPSGWYTTRPVSRSVASGLEERRATEPGATMTRASSAYFAYARPIDTLPTRAETGRTLVLGVPAAPHVEHLQSMQVLALGLLCLLSGGGVLAAHGAGWRTGRLFRPLAAQLLRVPRAVKAGEPVHWSDFGVEELAALAHGARRMEQELATQLTAVAESEERFRAIATNLPGGVSRRVMDPGGNIRFTYLSPNYERAFGIPVERALREPGIMQEVIHPEDRASYRFALERSARFLVPLDTTFRVRLPGDEIRWVRTLGHPRKAGDGSVVWDGIAIDETARKEAESELEYLARHDVLTGVLNRKAIAGRLARLLESASSRSRVAVLYVDLDRTKWINDTLGHAAGDCVIREAAARIRGAVRDADHVGRYGGDEFVVLATGIASRSGADTVAERIATSLRAPVTVGDHRIELAATIGILLHPAEGDDAEESLRKADVALYEAKRVGRGTWRFYEQALDADRETRTVLVTQLHEALASGQLFLEYQPKVCLARGRVIGVEALVRWRHPEQGIIPPTQFIPLAEESGLIDELGDWVLRRACADLATWRSRSPREAPEQVSVNVSGIQLRTEALWHSVRRALSESGLNPEQLELEVTEGVFYDARASSLRRLSAAGVRLAIDDYGKGYSSLFVLRDLPANVVKIDRAFVANAQNRFADRAIIASTIALAHELGRTVVAEGVETQVQLRMLRNMGCDMVQGFLFAKPASAAKVPKLCRMRW